MGAKVAKIAAYSAGMNLALSANALQKDGKCRILSLRGGGVHGAFEIGALKGLVDNMPPHEVMYEYVAGVSIGAVNASIFSTYPPGQEKIAVEAMIGMLNKPTSEFIDFYSPKVLAAFQHSSLADNQKFKSMVSEKLGDRPFARCLSIMSCDLQNGQVVIFDETMSNEDRVDGIIASTSIPFAFPPVELEDMLLIDGSMYSALSIGDPIQRCRDEVENDSDIIIDVILCYSTPVTLNNWTISDDRFKTAFDHYRRRKQITDYHNNQEDIMRMMRGYPDVQFRMLIEPEEALIEKGVVPIFATKEDLQIEIEQGKRAGTDAVENYKASGNISNHELVLQKYDQQALLDSSKSSAHNILS